MKRRIHDLFRFLVATALVVFPVAVNAGTVTNLTDQPSSTQIATGSNHKFTFTVTSTIAEGSVLSMTFPTDFTMSSILEDDVDITDDGVDLTTSSDCSGSDHASIGVSGQVLQVTICAGDGGAIANSSIVTIEIGTNASSSGLGTHRMTNPSAVASYFIALSETGGNAGSVIFTTTTAGSTAVSATVPTSATPPNPGTPATQCDDDYGNACTSVENACGLTDDGWINCDGECSASTPSDDLCSSVCDAGFGASCTSSSNSCGMTDTGTIACDGSCSAVTPSDSACPVLCVSTYGDSCTSSSNSCGMTDTGTIACDGSCSAVTPSENTCISSPVCSSRYGNACTSSANSCGITNEGVIGCDDSCSAGAPAETSCVPSACAATYGDACTSSANSCGMTNSGSVSCTGTCSAETPAEDYCTTSVSCAAHEGSACTSSANSCGMTNAGVFGCDGSCTAGTPLEGLCTMSICADNEGDACVSVQNSCGQVNEGTIGCNGACSATAPAEKYCVPVVPVESVSGSSGIVETIERFREAPVTQAAVAVATPVAIVTAVSTVAVLTTSLNLLAYIQFIFTSPLMLIHRRKRKPFGIVYHAVTKVPVDLAVVRLYTADTNRLVKSAVTNAEGKYFFVVEPGQYRLSATKHDFVFPSTYLQDVKDDGVFLDVYTGQTIVVTAHDATIAANIPLDGAQGEHAQTPRGILVKKALRKLQFGLALSGSVLSALVYILAPSWLTLGLAAGQVIIFCVFVRLARVKKPKGWGVVYDATTRRPVGKAIVRLFEPKYNKLVETTITDSLGRYSFLVGANEYFMRTSKDGYGEHTVNTIDYRQHTEPLPLAVDVPLTPEKPL